MQTSGVSECYQDQDQDHYQDQDHDQYQDQDQYHYQDQDQNQYPLYPQYWWPGDQQSYNQEDGDGGAYRGRCHTWPRSESWSPTDSHSPAGLPSLTEETDQAEREAEAEAGDTKVDETPYGRRNPWGPFSYAQLITQAICSEPDQRMTLNQIYEFLISNFPYFAERRSHQLSAGWKVKLSLLRAGD